MSRIEVVCTDEQQHHRTSIGWFRQSGEQWVCNSEVDAVSMRAAEFSRAGKGVFRHQDAWSFKCGNCGKYVRVSFADAQDAMTLLVSMAVYTLDVSLLVRILATRARVRGEHRERR